MNFNIELPDDPLGTTIFMVNPVPTDDGQRVRMKFDVKQFLDDENTEHANLHNSLRMACVGMMWAMANYGEDEGATRLIQYLVSAGNDFENNATPPTDRGALN